MRPNQLECDHETITNLLGCTDLYVDRSANLQLPHVLLVALSPGASQDLIPDAILKAQSFAGLFRF